MPSTKRPPLISSSVAADMAMSAGDRLNVFMMPVPSSIRRVFTAISASSVVDSYPQTSGSQNESYPSLSASFAALRYIFRSYCFQNASRPTR